MLYLNLSDLNEPLSSVREAPLLKDTSYRLTFKGRNLFERRQNVNRVVSDEEALCLKKKTVKPHWTVFYQVIRKQNL